MLLELSDICFFVKSFKLHESPDQSFSILKHVSFSQNNTRSGTFNKLVQPPIKLNRDKQFYFNRFPHLWNSLPPIDLSLSFVTIRKQLIDIFWKSFLAKFNPDVSCSYYFACPCPRCFSQPKSSFNWCTQPPNYIIILIFYYVSRLLQSCNRPSAIEAVKH